MFALFNTNTNLINCSNTRILNPTMQCSTSFIILPLLLNFANAEILIPKDKYGDAGVALINYASRIYRYESYYASGRLIAIICGKYEDLCGRFIKQLDASHNLSMPYIVTKGYNMKLFRVIIQFSLILNRL